MQGALLLQTLLLAVAFVSTDASVFRGAPPAFLKQEGMREVSAATTALAAHADDDDSLDGFGTSFEIKNYDYFGLTNRWSDPFADEEESPKDAAAKKESGNPIVKAMKKMEKGVDRLIDKALEPLSKAQPQSNSPHWEAFFQLSGEKCWRASDLQVKQLVESESAPLTNMDVIRTAIKSSILGAIQCEKSKEKSLLSMEAAPGKEKESLKGPRIHVTFRPGEKTPTLSLLADPNATSMLNKPRPSLIATHSSVARSHWSVIVDVTITDRPENGVSELKGTQKLLKKAMNSGKLKGSLQETMFLVTGTTPDIRRIKVEAVKIKQWDVDKCEKHMTQIVNLFTLHYSRMQVPMALYNECTNFMPKMSFSRDHILDSRDASRCRKATVAFEKHWKYGKNAEPKDFQKMCIMACEAKYGTKAPLCHVTKGDKLMDAPKL